MLSTSALLLGPVCAPSEVAPGSYIAVLCPPGSELLTGLSARSFGWEARDSLLCLLPGACTCLCLLFRMPPQGDVCSNVLRHGAGALSIDRSRVYTDWQEADRPETWKRSGYTAKPDALKIAAPPGFGICLHPGGRWPTNVVFVHDPACVRTQEGPKTTWTCAKGCPVLVLNTQSGERRSTGPHPSQTRAESNYRPGQGAYQTQGPLYADSGGASRFYPEFATVQELLDWLRLLISTDPKGCWVSPSLTQKLTYPGQKTCA